jgi:hypothetical protein
MQPAMSASKSASDRIYLELAWEAVGYVRGKVKAGTANRAEDFAERKGKKFQELDQESLNRQRNTLRMLVSDAKQPTTTSQAAEAPKVIDIEDDICYQAEFVELSGFGNCGEQAAVAYKYLRRFPLAGLVYINLKNGNHSFVVIGAGPGIIENTEFTIREAFHQLGSGAIICDPWLSGGGRCFRVQTEWSQAIDLMLKEAKPDANPDTVRIQCIARCSHKTRATKVREWNKAQSVIKSQPSGWFSWW